MSYSPATQQFLKGAKDEGLENLVIAAGGRDKLYRRYPFVDEAKAIPKYADFEALDDELRSVAPMRFGEAAPGVPFTVVPRNAGIRLTFSAPLGVDDGFFVEREGGDPEGAVTALRNTEAVQLLRIRIRKVACSCDEETRID